MPRLTQRLCRTAAIELLIEAKVVSHEYRSMVLGSKTEIIFGFGSIDADKNGFFKRSDVCRLIGYGQMWAKGEL